MSFRLDLQSAPERRGTIGTPSAWSGSGPTPTFSGTYLGSVNVTATFTVTTAGVIGTAAVITVSWSTGLDSGKLHLGTDHGYIAGTVVNWHKGASVAFAAGTFVIANTLTVVLTAANALMRDHTIIQSTLGPVDIAITGMQREDLDILQTSFDGRTTRTRAGMLRHASIAVDYLDAANRDRLAYLESARHRVALAENYDETTLFLLSGHGYSPPASYNSTSTVLPFIGPAGAFSRGTQELRSYVDRRTGLVSHTLGPGIESGQVGGALCIDGGTSNLFARTSAKSGTLYFTASGAPTTILFDATVKPPHDSRDTYALAAFLAGTLRVAFSSATVAGDLAHSDDVTVAASTTYTASIWLRGRGSIVVDFRAGAGAAGNTRAQLAITLTNEWVRYSLTGATIGGENTGDIVIQSTGTAAVCWASHWQLEAKPAVTAHVQADGAADTRLAETLTFPLAIPVYEGTVAFWLYWGGDDSTTTYSIVETTGVAGSERFALWYSSSTSNLQYYTSTSTPLNGAVNLAAGSWSHIALTWEADPTPGFILRSIYLNGALLSGPTPSVFWQPSYGTGFALAPALAGATLVNARFQGVRIDSEAKTAAEILDIYERGTSEFHKTLELDTTGRHYWISNVSEAWRSNARADHYLMTADLREADREDDTVLVAT